MIELDISGIQILNQRLREALKRQDVENERQDIENVFITASEVLNFWSDFSNANSALENMGNGGIQSKNPEEATEICEAIAICRMLDNDFWNGDIKNLNNISNRFQSKIRIFAEQILEQSVEDLSYFGETS